MQTVLVTGGSGFLGRYVVKALQATQKYDVTAPPHSCFNLLDRVSIAHMFDEFRPDIVIHLAAVCGGIGANQKEPGRFFYENLKMGMEMIEMARIDRIRKFVQVGTVCAYPKFCPTPFHEDNLWAGYPEETNAPYGIAKKALLVQCQAYREQYGLNAIYMVPVNLYGPGDNFDLQTSHVIPALIRKCIDAKRQRQKSIDVWGTGAAYREFLYVEDCAEAIVRATQVYDSHRPVNLGTGNEIRMTNLVDLIAELTGFEGDLIWDGSKPDGQPRRRLDTNRAFTELNWQAKTTLKEGLIKTIQWWETQYATSSCAQ